MTFGEKNRKRERKKRKRKEHTDLCCPGGQFLHVPVGASQSIPAGQEADL